MTTIEVTKKTFYKVFNSKLIPQSVERKELFVKENYFYDELDQKGYALYNHLTSAWQYYLIDINA